MSALAEWLVRHAPAWLDSSVLTPAQRRALTAIVRCRTPDLGGHVYRCTSCAETDFAYHSCHHRACPRCGGAGTAEWTAKQEARLLPVPYFLVTFTVPEAMRPVFAARPEVMYDLLFDCAAAALQSVAAQPRLMGADGARSAEMVEPRFALRLGPAAQRKGEATGARLRAVRRATGLRGRIAHVGTAAAAASACALRRTRRWTARGSPQVAQDAQTRLAATGRCTRGGIPAEHGRGASRRRARSARAVA